MMRIEYLEEVADVTGSSLENPPKKEAQIFIADLLEHMVIKYGDDRSASYGIDPDIRKGIESPYIVFDRKRVYFELSKKYNHITFNSTLEAESNLFTILRRDFMLDKEAAMVMMRQPMKRFLSQFTFDPPLPSKKLKFFSAMIGR